MTHGHNAYINSGRLYPTNATDVVLTSFTYATGPLSRWYQQSTNLFNKGSTNAHLLGLWHYTTTTNQVKETNTVVDIGFHYVSFNLQSSTPVPYDTDGDGLADYLEDWNGNGSLDSGESDYTAPDTDNDGVNDFIERLLGRNPRVYGVTNDVNNAINLRRYTPLK